MGANIPLPALDVRPPQQQTDPLETYSRLVQLRSLAQQQQLQQQELIGRQQQNQTQALQLQDSLKMRELTPQFVTRDQSGKVTGYDWNGFQNAAMSAGVSPGTIAGVGKAQADYQLSLQNLNAKQRENQEALNKFAFDSLENIRGEKDPMQRQAKYQQAVQKGAQMGADVRAFPQQVPDDNGLDVLEAGLGMHAQALANAKTGAETFEATQKGQQAEAEKQRIQAEMQGITGPFAEAKYRNILGNLAAHKPVSADDLDFARSYELSKRETTTSSDTLGVTSNNTRGPAGLAAAGRGVIRPIANATPGQAGTAIQPIGTASPQAAKDSIVDLVGQYKLNPSMLQRMIVKHPDVIAAVQQKYPDFDQTTYQAKSKIITGYTSGTQSKEINAINTAMGHLKALDDAVDALNNGDVTLLNRIGNQFGINVTGQTAAAAFKTILHRVGPEITGAYIPGAGGEQERFANEQDFSENLPPQTLHRNVATSVELLRSKIGALENQYKNTVGRDDFQQRFITPAAQASLNKFSGQGGNRSSGGPTPQTHAFSLSAWQRANPGGNANAARAAAIQQGYQVVP